MRQPNLGFVAGTLIHTDKGLVPIEQIKVGDMVLSMPENGRPEEKAYKRVIGTFKSDDKRPIMSTNYGDSFCTEGHPFAVIETDGRYGELIWKPASSLDWYDIQYTLSQYNGEGGWNDALCVYEQKYSTDPFGIGGLFLLQTAIEDIAIYDQTNYEFDHDFRLVDFRSGKSMFVYSNHSQYERLPSEIPPNISSGYIKGKESYDNVIVLDKYNDKEQIEFYEQIFQGWLDSQRNKAYSTYVYGIEVEDYHTYFVGHEGFWVKS